MAEETKNILQIEQGGVIFHKGDPVRQIALLIKGSVMVSDDFIQLPIRTGEIVGIMDMESPEYLFDYIASEAVTVYIVNYQDIEDLGVISTAIKDHRNYIIRSACDQLDSLLDIYETLDGVTHKLYNYLKEYYKKYQVLCDDYLKKKSVSAEIEELKMFDDSDSLEEREIRYFQSLSELPENIRNAFFEDDDDILSYHIYMAAELARDAVSAAKVRFEFYQSAFVLLFQKGSNNIFAMFSKLAMEVAAAGGDISKLMHELDKIIALIRECKDMEEETLGLEFGYDFARIRDIYQAIGEKGKKQEAADAESEDQKSELLFTFSEDQMQRAVEETTGSLKKILLYSGIAKEKAEMFEKYLTVYRGLKDPFSTDNDVRKLRSRIAELYYEIYELCFFKSEEEGMNDRIIEMFLDFGYMDERMFDKKQLVSLYYTKQELYHGKKGTLTVYSIREWLHAIYMNEKMPSKNEFDLDYEENLRELKKRQRFTPEEEKAYLSDRKGKVHYEIENMLRANSRLTNGQISTFCPILNGRDFVIDVGEMFISGEKAEQALLEITAIDFSAFYREYLFEDVENKISRINLNKEVLPDIILMPTAGHKGSMWQEISGKRRDTPGRFVLPAFTADTLQDLMIRMVAAFRWELCRTIQGTYWNDVREKSLTAEYCDYVQFYRKNRELSEDAKQKIKVQLQKSRNNTREMFIKDYEVWVKHEAFGMARANKVVRGILSVYCPFSKEYRLKIAQHPMFQEGVARYEREKQKKLKEFTNRITAIRNAGGVIIPVLEENLEYLREQ